MPLPTPTGPRHVGYCSLTWREYTALARCSRNGAGSVGESGVHSTGANRSHPHVRTQANTGKARFGLPVQVDRAAAGRRGA